MTDHELINFKKKSLDIVGPGFCAAKWYNATIWLGTGRTSSCHHPPAHDISLDEIKNNPSAIHNTLIKKLVRKQMLEGKRPLECEYCWKVEDVSEELISDRVFKSIIYSQEKINEISKRTWKDDTDLETLEIAFNRLCNLACSYCGPSYSTRWSSDIKMYGPYLNLSGDCSREFSRDGAEKDKYLNNADNPYSRAFWQWWPKLKYTLKELRVTGGEPLLANETWFVMDKYIDDKLNFRFALNSNLSVSSTLIDKLIVNITKINNFHMYTSCETTGSQAEYIRDGLDFNSFISNCERVLGTENLKSFTVMMTINSICLFSLCDMIDIVLGWKEKYQRVQVSFTLNILRFPSFMSVVVLPMEMRLERAIFIEIWLKNKQNENSLDSWESASIQRLIDYLKTVDRAHVAASDIHTQQSDFKNYFLQFDKRREKSFENTFPSALVSWLNGIELRSTNGD